MATFTEIPSHSSSVDVQPRILNATFGDGYEANAFDGINHSPEMWDLVFTDRTLADAASIVDFFKNNNTATTTFDWTTPDGNAGKYLCKSWKRNYTTSLTATISCRFEQKFW